MQNRARHDAFISHASEDKDDFVRPLVSALEAAGFDIWYDEFSLKVGDISKERITVPPTKMVY